MELTQNRVQFLAFIFPVLTVRVFSTNHLLTFGFHRFDLLAHSKYGSYRNTVGLPGRGIGPSRDLYTQMKVQAQELPTCIHGASGNRTLRPCVRAQTPFGHCDRLCRSVCQAKVQ